MRNFIMLTTVFSIAMATCSHASLQEQDEALRTKVTSTSKSKIKETDTQIRSSSPSLFKKLFVLGLLASSGIVNETEAQAVPAWLEPNMSLYLNMTYEETMPPNGKIIQQYIYKSSSTINPYVTISSSTGQRSWNYDAQMKDTYCLFWQRKIARAQKIRETTNKIYSDIQYTDKFTIQEQYTLLLSALNVEIDSHRIEMEAAENIGKDRSCALPGQVDSAPR